MAVETLTVRNLSRATLARQMLLARERVGVIEAIERLGGLQAQEPRPPFAGLWTRLEGFGTEDLRGALHARDVVRGTLMRATLHLASARDYAAFRPALQPVLTDAMRALGSRAKGLDLDAVLPAARELVAEEPRTFNELRALLSAAFPDVNERALGYSVRMNLPLVMVPSEDRFGFPRTARFTLADEWIGAPTAGDAEGLALRYLAAFGPATAADLQTWSGLRGTAAVLDGLRERLAVFADERGRELFDLPDAPRPGGDVPAPPRLLPDFDSVLLAHADRSRVIADEHRPAVVTKNLRVKATFLVDGVVAGTWAAQRKGASAKLALSPFAKLRKRDATALAAEAEALLRFLEDDARTFDVRVGPV